MKRLVFTWFAMVAFATAAMVLALALMLVGDIKRMRYEWDAGPNLRGEFFFGGEVAQYRISEKWDDPLATTTPYARKNDLKVTRELDWMQLPWVGGAMVCGGERSGIVAADPAGACSTLARMGRYFRELGFLLWRSRHPAASAAFLCGREKARSSSKAKSAEILRRLRIQSSREPRPLPRMRACDHFSGDDAITCR
jgi:hypothetical protein